MPAICYFRPTSPTRNAAVANNYVMSDAEIIVVLSQIAGCLLRGYNERRQRDHRGPVLEF